MNRQRQLLKMLPPKQQTLEFGGPNIWQQLPESQQRACQSAISDLIYQVGASTSSNVELVNEKEAENE